MEGAGFSLKILLCWLLVNEYYIFLSDLTFGQWAILFSTKLARRPNSSLNSLPPSERRAPQTMRDSREDSLLGYILKSYTKEGNVDWVYFSTIRDYLAIAAWPLITDRFELAFFIRDLAKFPLLVNAQRHHPPTNLKDAMKVRWPCL